MRTLAVADDPLFLEHHSKNPHPERPERLEAAREGLARALGARTEALQLELADATEDQLTRVHTARYLEDLGQRAGQWGHLDADTYHAPLSVAAARRAAGGALAVVDALVDARADGGLALLRPPGHHARPDAAMGFCLVNNIAVAAAHARARGLQRVAIVDFDVHHGNGTQEMFYADPNVLFVSLHQYPFYPGSGAASEVGSGDGTGYTVNVPLSSGASDAAYHAAFERLVLPIVEQYAPDMLLVSAGFDAHARDPLASMQLSSSTYGYMLSALRGALPERARGRIGLFLEGGYDLRALRESLEAAVAGLGQDRSFSPAVGEIQPDHVRELEVCRAIQRRHFLL
jgi:acetoin utilization deacetylase AcuC-like enzyme